MTPHEAYANFLTTDNAWSDELRRRFGKRAGDVRYTAEGRTGEVLERLHAAREAARVEWERLVLGREVQSIVVPVGTGKM